MSKIKIEDLNTVNQITELSETELSAKGGFFGLFSLFFGGFRRSYGYGGKHH